MLYVGKKKWSKSLDAYLRSEDVFTDDESKREIEKLINKGVNVYLTINPYLSEMHSETEIGTHKNHLLWDTDLDRLTDLTYQLSEDV